MKRINLQTEAWIINRNELKSHLMARGLPNSASATITTNYLSQHSHTSTNTFVSIFYRSGTRPLQMIMSLTILLEPALIISQNQSTTLERLTNMLITPSTLMIFLPRTIPIFANMIDTTMGPSISDRLHTVIRPLTLVSLVAVMIPRLYSICNSAIDIHGRRNRVGGDLV